MKTKSEIKRKPIYAEDFNIYVPENIARKAMEYGFICEGYGMSNTDTEQLPVNKFYYKKRCTRLPEKHYYQITKCPTAEQMCGWLRQVKDIHVIADADGYNNEKITGYFYSISGCADGINHFSDPFGVFSDDRYTSYEEAIIAGIQHGLELINYDQRREVARNPE